MCKPCGVVHCHETEQREADYEKIVAALREVMPWANYADSGFRGSRRRKNALEFLNGIVRANAVSNTGKHQAIFREGPYDGKLQQLESGYIPHAINFPSLIGDSDGHWGISEHPLNDIGGVKVIHYVYGGKVDACGHLIYEFKE